MRKIASLTLMAPLVAVAAAQDFGGWAARRPGAGDYAVESGGALVGVSLSAPELCSRSASRGEP
jgi:hypothetical protein